MPFVVIGWGCDVTAGKEDSLFVFVCVCVLRCEEIVIQPLLSDQEHGLIMHWIANVDVIE